MKKIVQVIPYSYHIHHGGLEKIADTLSRELGKQFLMLNRASNISASNKTVISSESREDTLFMPSFDLIAWFPVPWFWKKEFWKQLRQIKEIKPDVIVTHTRFFLQSLLWWVLAKMWGCKRVHIEHGSWFVNWYSWYVRLCAWLFDRTVGLRIFRQCGTIVTISQMHKKFISKFTKKEPVVIYNPIDFAPQEKIKNTVPHIWFVGRLVPLKWVDVLINALKQLQDKERVCTIVGNWPQRELLEAMVASFGMQDRIHFVWADDRANRLHKFDIFVNPSYQEWVPTTVIEALMAKCIVVATDVWGTREISDRDDLLLVKPWQKELLELLLRKTIDEFHASIWLSYNIVTENFSVKNSIKKYISLLQKLSYK